MVYLHKDIGDAVWQYSENAFDAEGVKFLSELLMANTTLTGLDLSSRMI